MKSIIAILFVGSWSGLGCESNAADTKAVVAKPTAATPTTVHSEPGVASAKPGERENCAEAGKAHADWVKNRIPTDAGMALAQRQESTVVDLCTQGDWARGTLHCFAGSQGATDTDRCAERLSSEQKTAVSNLFTEVLSVQRGELEKPKPL